VKKYYFVFFLLLSWSCTKDKALEVAKADLASGFPSDVSVIVNNKCSTTGCHTTSARAATGGLAMQTWNQLFDGGNGGAVAIAYRPDQSWLMYFTNTDTSWGPVLTPTMPYLSNPLSKTEWQTLNNWMAAGAPNKDGVVPFSGNPDRKKFYVSNQGCDFVSVFDADTKLCMRCIDVGQSPAAPDVPHQIKISPDGQYWYAVLYAGTVLQKFSAIDDSHIGDIPLGDGSATYQPTGQWSTISITPDGKIGFVVDWESDSKIAVVNLETMSFITQYKGLAFTHGSCINSTGTTLYVTSQTGNYIYKFDVTNPFFASYEKITLDGLSWNNIEGHYDPHEIMLAPDESKYFVTCQSANAVYVMDATSDTLIAAIAVGKTPLEMGISKDHNELFVTCEYEPSSEPKTIGEVDVIDLNTLQVIKKLQDGLYEPHGIGVMDTEGYVVIASLNYDGTGPAPHHVSNCGGRNGFLKLIDLGTLEFIPNYRTEVSVYPYSVTVRK